MELYLDHAATTPLEPEVLDAMRPWLATPPGNPSSSHAAGRRARAALEDARARVGRALGVDPARVVFTSGGTEANNLGVIGAARARRAGGRHLLSQPSEHPSVLRALEALSAEGFEVEHVPIDGRGLVDPAALATRVREDTTVVALMHANNETGVVQPVAEVARALAGRAHLHVDAVQSAGWLDTRGLPGTLSLSAHKLGGPVGVGALVGRGDLAPVLFGGPQEGRLRPGTEPVALEHALARRSPAEVAASRDALEAELLLAVRDTRPNGAGAPRLPGHLNVSFDGVSGEAVVAALDLEGIAASSGSACATGDPGPSHVLVAMGLGRDRARASVRLSLARPLSAGERSRVVGVLAAAVLRLRRLGA